MLQLVTWNIYCGPMKNVDGQWDALEWPARRDAVTTEIVLCHGMQPHPTVFCFQEVMEEHSLVDLTNLLGNSHHLFYVKTSPRNMATLTAIPKYFTNVKMLDSSMIERPAGWFPGCSIVSFEHDGKTVVVVNSHASTKQSAREMICMSLAKEIRRLQFNTLEADIVLWAGDFNAFPDAGGVELFYQLQNLACMVDATSVIVSPHDATKRVLTTVKAYPDDAFMPTGPLLPYHLDHILVSGDCTYGPPTCDETTKGSDHFPVKLQLKFSN